MSLRVWAPKAFWLNWQALCQPDGPGGLGELGVAAGMWAAMVLAMMLPTAGPMILTYAEIADTAARKGEPVVSPMVLTAGYVGVWLGFALAAAALQWMLAGGPPNLQTPTGITRSQHATLTMRVSFTRASYRGQVPQQASPE